MITNKHRVNYTMIPANLQARIIKVDIDSYTQQPHFLISIPAIDFEYWTFESNMIAWKDYKEVTDREQEIINAGKVRAQQIKKYYAGELNIGTIDKDNPLKQFTELQK